MKAKKTDRLEYGMGNVKTKRLEKVRQKVRQLFTQGGKSRVVKCFVLPAGKVAVKELSITLICILADKTVNIITLPFQSRIELCSVLKLLGKMTIRGRIGRSPNCTASQLVALADTCFLNVLPNSGMGSI